MKKLYLRLATVLLLATFGAFTPRVYAYSYDLDETNSWSGDAQYQAQSNQNLTSVRSTNGLTEPFDRSVSPFSSTVRSRSVSNDDDGDDYDSGGSSGFDGPGEAGDDFKTPLGAPLTLLLFAAGYAFVKNTFRKRETKH